MKKKKYFSKRHKYCTTKKKLTQNIEASRPERNVRHQIGVYQGEQASTEAVKDLRRQQSRMARVFEPHNECTSNGERSEGGQKERFPTDPAERELVPHKGGRGHCDLCRNNGSGDQRNCISGLSAALLVLPHQFTKNQQHIRIRKAEMARG